MPRWLKTTGWVVGGFLGAAASMSAMGWTMPWQAATQADIDAALGKVERRLERIENCLLFKQCNPLK